MLDDKVVEESRCADPPTAAGPTRSLKGVTTARILAFAGCFALILVYALRGGAYDVVVFQEHGLVIWWTLAIAIGLGLVPRARPPKAVLALVGGLLAYALWTGLSLLWTQSSERTTEELARVLDYAGLVAFVGATIDRRTWRAGAAGLGLGALIVCVLALGTRLAPSTFPTDYLDRAFHLDRLSYPFGYWNAVAAWGAMSTAIGLAWSAHDASRLRSAVALAFVPVAGLTTYLTYSRAGVAGTGLAVLAVLALSRSRIRALIHCVVAAAGSAAVIGVTHSKPEIAHATGTRGSGAVFGVLALAMIACFITPVATAAAGARRWRVPRPAGRPILAVCGLVVIVAAVAVGPTLVRRGWHSFTQTSMGASSDPTARLGSLSGSRYPLWKVTVKAFDAHPLNGTGAGTLEFWWNQHGTDAEYIRDAHNIWLQNMAELGLPGLLLIVGVAVTGVFLAASVRWRARRTESAGVAAAFLAAFLVYLLHASVDWMWESTAVTVLALAGVAVVGARGGASQIRLKVPVRALAVAVAVGAGLMQLPGLISTAALRRSQADERAGNPTGALAWAQRAVDAEPWSASAYEQRGLVRESAGQLAPAAQDLQRAISHEPTNYQHWVVLARIDTERGQLVSAGREYRRAHQLRPLASVFTLAPYFSGAPSSPAGVLASPNGP
jgi:O-Antigen ligase